MPDNAVRLRRDFGAILSLIRAHALLHVESRERDERGRVVATEADYEAVRHLVGDVIGEAVGAKVTDQVRETVAAVAALEKERIVGVNSKHVAEFLGIDTSTAWRRLKLAAKNGYVRDHRIGRTGPNDWRTEDLLPEDQTMLPPLRGLTRDCDDGLDGHIASDQGDCMIAPESRGVETHGVFSAQGALALGPPSDPRNHANAQVEGGIGTQSPIESASTPVQPSDDCPECGCSQGRHFHNCPHDAEEGA